MRRALEGNLRHKLLLLVLFPILVVVPGTLGFAVYWAQTFTYDQLLRKANTDLSVAHDVFARLQKDYMLRLENLAQSYAFRTAFEEQDMSSLDAQIEQMRVENGFAFLAVNDLYGRRYFEAQPYGVLRSKLSLDLLASAARGTPAVGVEIFSPQELGVESEELVDRVRLPLVATRHATPTTRTVEDRAMVVRTMAPIRNLRGRVVAVLDGGVLLNGNFEFVDAIRDLVYGPGSLPEGGIGAVTVLLDDVRISTNVPLREGDRALGTRVSEEVRKRVLEEGEVWLDSAFVVNDWYISAYEPIEDVNGRRVGMLYAGYLEGPFRAAHYRAVAVLLVLLLAGMIFAAGIAISGAKTIFQPIEAIARVVRATQAGRESRIGPLDSRDEVGELARQFDQMLDLLTVRNEQVRQAAEKLESKVEERTQELKDKNQRLQETIDLLHQTRRQLVVSEKLAALGELTAGVAHEINNPVAVMLGNIEILRQELGEQMEPVSTEVDLIIEQVDRIRAIVDKLLRYSRPSAFAGYLEKVDVDTLLEDTLVLVRHELASKGLRVERSFAASRRVAIDPQELQQVLVNLLMNAVQASDHGGRIRLTTEDWEDQGVSLTVADDGVGIGPEQLKRVFDPFFTTKKEGGTGLGLSVSYGLIRRYGGNITVTSEPGHGATFVVQLLEEPAFTEDPPAQADDPRRQAGHHAA